MGVVLYGPLRILAIFSFNDSIIIALPLEGFTTKWYSLMFQDPCVIESLKNSLILSFVVTPVWLILGRSRRSASPVSATGFERRSPAWSARRWSSPGC